jgi:hypothetical protein
VPRCTSELCGVRQRRARWAQKLESTIQRKTFEVVEHLRRQGCVEGTQLQTKSLRSSVKLCQVGIEQVQGVHRVQDSESSERSKNRVHRREHCWMFCKKILCQVGIE